MILEMVALAAGTFWTASRAGRERGVVILADKSGPLAGLRPARRI